MAVKNNRRTKITRLLLKDSLIELMHNKNINQITIKEICEHADLNRSTFYLHYSDQFSLLEDLENDILETAFTYLRDVGPTLDTLSYIETFLNYVKDNSDIFETLFCHQENMNFQGLFINKIMEQLKGNLSFHCSETIVNYIYSFLLNGCIHIIIDWMNRDYDLPSSTVSKIIFELCDHCSDVTLQ